MEHLWNDFYEAMLGRLSGPMHVRFYIQPTLAIIFAVRDGLYDARYGHALWLYTVLRDPALRRELLAHGWHSVSRVCIMAFVIDMVYQVTRLDTFHPGVSALVAFFAAFLPYALVRGPVNRLARRMKWGTPASPEAQAQASPR